MPDQRASRTSRRKTLLVVFSLSIVICVALVEYSPYELALAWHCMHGNYAQIGGYRVRLPLLWRKVNIDSYHTSSLVRACSIRTFLKPKIMVEPMLAGTMRDTDLETLQSIQGLTAIPNSASPFKASSSLAILKPHPFTLYCNVKEYLPPHTVLGTNLFCAAPKVPYSFTYDGPPRYEKEAESILTSIE